MEGSRDCPHISDEKQQTVYLLELTVKDKLDDDMTVGIGSASAGIPGTVHHG